MDNQKINGLVAARGSDYGHPLEDFTRTSQLWSAYLGILVQPDDVPIMMILLKCSREKHKHKKDNIDDIQGYAETILMLKYESNEKNPATSKIETLGRYDQIRSGQKGPDRAEDQFQKTPPSVSKRKH